MDPDDIVQSVFRRFLGAARDGRYVLPSGDELWGLLVVIALNRVRTAERHHRASKRDVRQTVELPPEEVVAADPDAAFAVIVDEALAGLPADHLPPDHAAAAAELARVDLEYGWADGRPRPVADYLAEFPALGARPDLLAGVCFEEYRQRADRGLGERAGRRGG